MLGRGVADVLTTTPTRSLFSQGVRDVTSEADIFLLNLECCISAGGEPWAAPGKPFFFRAPPHATEVLSELGVDCVTLANNHALDYGYPALLDTLDQLDAAGIRWTGAGPDHAAARAPARLAFGRQAVTIVAFADHPEDFAATDDRPGIAYAGPDGDRLPDWLVETMSRPDGGWVIVSPHWGPNMTPRPLPRVRRMAQALLDAGADLVAGHSAHVFHGVTKRILYDLGDFIDDYAVDPELRNDLGILFLVHMEAAGPAKIEGVPLKLEYCYTRLAEGDDFEWVQRRLLHACRELGTEVRAEGDRLIIE